jgi:hypothetical protein
MQCALDIHAACVGKRVVYMEYTSMLGWPVAHQQLLSGEQVVAAWQPQQHCAALLVRYDVIAPVVLIQHALQRRVVHSPADDVAQVLHKPVRMAGGDCDRVLAQHSLPINEADHDWRLAPAHFILSYTNWLSARLYY